MARHVVWNGVGYDTLSQAARANGVSKAAMAKRLDNGYTCDEDMPGTGSVQQAKPTLWDGVQYPSIAEAARANNISYHGMWKRVHNGYTCDDDLKW